MQFVMRFYQVICIIRINFHIHVFFVKASWNYSDDIVIMRLNAIKCIIANQYVFCYRRYFNV